LVESFYEQVFVHHLFHADPHPGNFLVVPGRKPSRPKIVVLDFGAVSDVQPHMVDGMIEIIAGILEEDRDRLLDGFYRMGFASREANRELLERTVNTYFQKLLRIQDRTPGALMRASQTELEQLADPELAREELRELMKSVDYPEGWFYVERASVLMFWLVGQIDADVDAMRIGFPYVMPLVMQKRAEKRSAAEEPVEGIAV
jgi:predicted unusual protein kinase regulating ubiquinone biosynthesis (AarF/ABC1/UbiB family)